MFILNVTDHHFLLLKKLQQSDGEVFVIANTQLNVGGELPTVFVEHYQLVHPQIHELLMQHTFEGVFC